jgi:hypothetical protein
VGKGREASGAVCVGVDGQPCLNGAEDRLVNNIFELCRNARRWLSRIAVH